MSKFQHNTANVYEVLVDKKVKLPQKESNLSMTDNMMSYYS